MRVNEIITEGKNVPCIVVDVQPEYDNYIHFDKEKMGMFLENQKASILVYYNGVDTGLSNDSDFDVMDYWHDEIVKADDFFERVVLEDKGFGYFRSWMSFGVSDAGIIKTIRLMYQNKVNDSRQLFGGEDSDDYKINMQALLGADWNDYCIDDPLTVEWTSVAQLKKFNGSYIMGGGRRECLREVELLMNAFNIKYKRVEDFVYG